MANIVKFKINGLSGALNNVYTRVTDLSRAELFQGQTLVSDALGNVELDIGNAGASGQGVIVYGDNYSAGNEETFKSFCGYGLIESAASLIYDNVVYFGASIMYGGFEETSKANYLTKRFFTKEGINDINVYTKTLSGSTSLAWRTMIDDFMTDNPSIVGSTLFVLQGAGNDITTGRPYATDSNLAAIESNMRYLFDKVKNAGWDIAYMGAAYKAYANVPPYENGSEPYNENIYYPLLREYAPQWWDNTYNVPVMDSYNFFKHNISAFSADGIHPRNIACEYIFNGWVNQILIRYMNNLPEYDYSGKKIVTCWSSKREVDGEFDTTTGISRFMVGEGTSGTGRVYDEQGAITPMAQIIGGGLPNEQGVGNPSNTTYGVLNNVAVSGSIYDTGMVPLVSSIWLGGSKYAGLTGKIRFSSSRASTTGTRNTQFTVDGTTKTINSELTTPTYVEFDFTSDSDGVIWFSWMKTASSTHGYLSAIEIQFD